MTPAEYAQRKAIPWSQQAAAAQAAGGYEFLPENGGNPNITPTQYGVSPNDPYLQRSNDVAGAYGRELSTLDPYQGLLDQGYWQDQATRDATSRNTAQILNETVTANRGIASGLTGAAQSANTADYGVLGGLNDSNARSGAMDAQNVGDLRALNGSMRQLTAGGYGADVAANAQDLARQESAYGALGGYASGQYDLDSQAALAVADPEALAAQKEALGAYKERIDPKMTDAERALYLENRLQQEQSNRANRDANMRELSRQGMSGSTMQLSNLNASSQENATNRQLGDLKANAMAVQRAQDSLAGYAGLGSTIADQSFKRDFSTKNAADQMADSNRQLSFAGTQAQGNQANQMRTQNDALSTFNKEQSLQQQRFQDSFAAGQQNDAWGRGTDISTAGFKQTGAQDARAQGYADTATTSINNQFNRLGSAAQTNIGVNDSALKGQQDFNTQQSRDLDSGRAALTQSGEFAMGRTRAQIAAQSDVNGIVNKSIDNQQEDKRAADAQRAARAAQDRQQRFDESQRGLLDYIL